MTDSEKDRALAHYTQVAAEAEAEARGARATMGSHERPGQGETNDWLTPQFVLDALGPFDLDPCASESCPDRCAPRFFTWRDDGLHQDWGGAFVFCNPPYGPHVGKWLGKMISHGRGIALVFARTETAWAQPSLKTCAGVLFLDRRLTFLRPGASTRTPGNAGAPSMLVAYGDEARERIKGALIRGLLSGAWFPGVYAMNGVPDRIPVRPDAPVRRAECDGKKGL